MTIFCPICGKELTKRQITKRRLTCSRHCGNILRWQNTERREKRSEQSKAMWQNPAMKQQIISSITSTWSSKELRDKQSELLTLVYQSEELRNKVANATSTALANPEIKKKQSKNVKLALAKPEEKARRSKASKKSMTAYWQNLSEEDYKKHTAAMSTGKKIAYNNLTEQEKIERHNRLSISAKNAFKKLSEEQKCIINQKRIDTMRKRKTFTKSSWEDYSYNLLCNHFNFDDVIRQYYDKKRYPFKCDFYIKSLDLFIECHYGYRHCREPFDENNPEHLKRLEELKNRAVARKNPVYNNYTTCIYTWTDLDVRKRQCAISNNLNWLCFYCIDDFEQWLTNKGEI